MNANNFKWSALILTGFISGSFVISAAQAADSTTTTTTTTKTNADGSTTTEVQETSSTPDETVVAPAVGTGGLVGPTGVTGTIRRSDRRQDRRNGDARVDHNDGVDIDRNVNREIDRRH